MSEPVAEQIVALVKTRLSAYTDTYRSTRVATWQPKDLVINVQQGDLTKNEEQSHPGNPPAQAWDMSVIVAGIVKPSDTSTVAVDTFKNRFWAEMVKAITNATNWHQWGGNAINTDIGEVQEYTSDDGAAAGVMLTLTILFRTSENDPYTVRA